MSKPLTSGEISAHTGVSDRTIRQWQTEGILPKTDSLSVAVQFIISYHKGQTAEARRDRTKEGKGELYEQQVRLVQAQADKLELENRLRQEELVEANEIALTWSAYIGSCKGLLLNIPSRLCLEIAGISDPKKIQSMIQAALDEALLELSDEQFIERLERTTVSSPDL